MCAISNVIATGNWRLIIAFLSSISRRAAGIILKLAPIGDIRVPQYPAVRAKAPATTGLAPCANTNGIPIPAV